MPSGAGPTKMPRAAVTGGAGFLGSHLCARLLHEGWEVVCFDSLLTGDPGNLTEALAHGGLRFERYDVSNYLFVDGDVDHVLHLASPASPTDYLQYPIQTLKVGALGTLRALGLARHKGASFMLASTSEVYGDPKVHPQPESCWGNVNPVGPRGVYDEAKRYAEAIAMAYHRAHGLRVKIARISNTSGPRMRRRDGRPVPTFIDQALQGAPLTVHGDGPQACSLCYIDDMVEGIWRLLVSDLVATPGQPREPGGGQGHRPRPSDRGPRREPLRDRHHRAPDRRSGDPLPGRLAGRLRAGVDTQGPAERGSPADDRVGGRRLAGLIGEDPRMARRQRYQRRSDAVRSYSSRARRTGSIVDTSATGTSHLDP